MKLAAVSVATLAAVVGCVLAGVLLFRPSPSPAFACPITSPAQPTMAPGYGPEVVDLLSQAGLRGHITSYGPDKDHWVFIGLDTQRAVDRANCELLRLGVPSGYADVSVMPFMEY